MQWKEGATFKTLDRPRTGRLVAFRVCQAPICDKIYQTFDFVIRIPGLAGAVTKAATDQALVMPPSYILFYISQAVGEGRSVDEALNRVRSQMGPTCKILVPFWLCMHTVTFSVIPEHLRITWGACCAIFCNAIGSGLNQQARREQESVLPAKQGPPRLPARQGPTLVDNLTSPLALLPGLINVNMNC